MESAEVAQLPKTRVAARRGRRRKLLRLIDALEDHDDVDAVHANFDVDAEVLERVAGLSPGRVDRRRGASSASRLTAAASTRRRGSPAARPRADRR